MDVFASARILDPEFGPVRIILSIDGERVHEVSGAVRSTAINRAVQWAADQGLQLRELGTGKILKGTVPSPSPDVPSVP